MAKNYSNTNNVNKNANNSSYSSYENEQSKNKTSNCERIPIVRLPKIRTAKIWMRMMRRTTTNGIHGWQKQ